MKPKEDIFKCDLHKKLIHKSTMRQTTLPLPIRTGTCACQGVRNVRFSEHFVGALNK